MPARTHRQHRAALGNFAILQHGLQDDEALQSRALEISNNELDSCGAPLERRECTIHMVHPKLSGANAKSSPPATSDRFPCCECARRGDADGPTLTDASVMPDGSVCILDTSPENVVRRRYKVNRTWCSAARRASSAPPLPGGDQHYICEEHLSLLLAEATYLRMPVRVRDWLLRGCCLECAYECAGEVLPGPAGPTVPRLSLAQAGEILQAQAPLLQQLLYPAGLSDEELARASWGNEQPVVRQGEEPGAGGEMGALAVLPLRGRNWCLDCGCNPAVYLFKDKGDLASDRALCPPCWVALRARGSERDLARAAAMELSCCLREEMLLRLKIMLPRPAGPGPGPAQAQGVGPAGPGASRGAGGAAAGAAAGGTDRREGAGGSGGQPAAVPVPVPRSGRVAPSAQPALASPPARPALPSPAPPRAAAPRAGPPPGSKPVSPPAQRALPPPVSASLRGLRLTSLAEERASGWLSQGAVRADQAQKGQKVAPAAAGALPAPGLRIAPHALAQAARLATANPSSNPHAQALTHRHQQQRLLQQGPQQHPHAHAPQQQALQQLLSLQHQLQLQHQTSPSGRPLPQAHAPGGVQPQQVQEQLAARFLADLKAQSSGAQLAPGLTLSRAGSAPLPTQRPSASGVPGAGPVPSPARGPWPLDPSLAAPLDAAQAPLLAVLRAAVLQASASAPAPASAAGAGAGASGGRGSVLASLGLGMLRAKVAAAGQRESRALQAGAALMGTPAAGATAGHGAPQAPAAANGAAAVVPAAGGSEAGVAAAEAPGRRSASGCAAGGAQAPPSPRADSPARAAEPGPPAGPSGPACPSIPEPCAPAHAANNDAHTTFSAANGAPAVLAPDPATQAHRDPGSGVGAGVPVGTEGPAEAVAAGAVATAPGPAPAALEAQTTAEVAAANGFAPAASVPPTSAPPGAAELASPHAAPSSARALDAEPAADGHARPGAGNAAPLSTPPVPSAATAAAPAAAALPGRAPAGDRGGGGPLPQLFPSWSGPHLSSASYNTRITLPGRHAAETLGLPPPPGPAEPSARRDWVDVSPPYDEPPYFQGALVRHAPHLLCKSGPGSGTDVRLVEDDMLYIVRREALVRLPDLKQRQLLDLVRDHNGRGGPVIYAGPMGVVHDPGDLLSDVSSAVSAAEAAIRAAAARAGGGGGRGGDGGSAAEVRGPFPWTMGAVNWAPPPEGLGWGPQPGDTGAAAGSATTARAEGAAAAPAAPRLPPPPLRDHCYGPVHLCCMDMGHRYEYRLGSTPVSAAFQPFAGRHSPPEDVNHEHPVTPPKLLRYMRTMIDRFAVQSDPRVSNLRQQMAALQPPASAAGLAAAAASVTAGAAGRVAPSVHTSALDLARRLATARADRDAMPPPPSAVAAAGPSGGGAKRAADEAALPDRADAAKRGPAAANGPPAATTTAPSAPTTAPATAPAAAAAPPPTLAALAAAADGRVPVGLKVPVYPLTADDTLFMTSGDLMRLAHRTLTLHGPPWLRDVLVERHGDALDFGSCRPADGGLGVFAHFGNMLLRPLLALELATGAHVDRSQPATLMSFAVPFAVPTDLGACLKALQKGLLDRRHAHWIQARNLSDQWRIQHPAAAAAAAASTSSGGASGPDTEPDGAAGGPDADAPDGPNGTNPADPGAATPGLAGVPPGLLRSDAAQPVANAGLERAAKRGSVWVLVPGCRLHQLAAALNKSTKRAWPRNHNGFFSVKYGRDLDTLVGVCWRHGVPFHVAYHCEGDLLLPGMAAAHAVMPLHAASMKVSQDFLIPTGPALRLLWEIDQLRQEHHLMWANKRAKDLKAEPPPRAQPSAPSLSPAALAAAAAAAAARERERERERETGRERAQGEEAELQPAGRGEEEQGAGSRPAKAPPHQPLAPAPSPPLPPPAAAPAAGPASLLPAIPTRSGEAALAAAAEALAARAAASAAADPPLLPWGERRLRSPRPSPGTSARTGPSRSGATQGSVLSSGGTGGGADAEGPPPLPAPQPAPAPAPEAGQPPSGPDLAPPQAEAGGAPDGLAAEAAASPDGAAPDAEEAAAAGSRAPTPQAQAARDCGPLQAPQALLAAVDRLFGPAAPVREEAACLAALHEAVVAAGGSTAAAAVFIEVAEEAPPPASPARALLGAVEGLFGADAPACVDAVRLAALQGGVAAAEGGEAAAGGSEVSTGAPPPARVYGPGPGAAGVVAAEAAEAAAEVVVMAEAVAAAPTAEEPRTDAGSSGYLPEHSPDPPQAVAGRGPRMCGQGAATGPEVQPAQAGEVERARTHSTAEARGEGPERAAVASPRPADSAGEAGSCGRAGGGALTDVTDVELYPGMEAATAEAEVETSAPLAAAAAADTAVGGRAAEGTVGAAAEALPADEMGLLCDEPLSALESLTPRDLDPDLGVGLGLDLGQAGVVTPAAQAAAAAGTAGQAQVEVLTGPPNDSAEARMGCPGPAAQPTAGLVTSAASGLVEQAAAAPAPLQTLSSLDPTTPAAAAASPAASGTADAYGGAGAAVATVTGVAADAATPLTPPPPPGCGAHDTPMTEAAAVAAVAATAAAAPNAAMDVETALADAPPSADAGAEAEASQPLLSLPAPEPAPKACTALALALAPPPPAPASAASATLALPAPPPPGSSALDSPSPPCGPPPPCGPAAELQALLGEMMPDCVPCVQELFRLSLVHQSLQPPPPLAAPPAALQAGGGSGVGTEDPYLALVDVVEDLVGPASPGQASARQLAALAGAAAPLAPATPVPSAARSGTDGGGALTPAAAAAAAARQGGLAFNARAFYVAHPASLRTMDDRLYGAIPRGAYLISPDPRAAAMAAAAYGGARGKFSGRTDKGNGGGQGKARPAGGKSGAAAAAMAAPQPRRQLAPRAARPGLKKPYRGDRDTDEDEEDEESTGGDIDGGPLPPTKAPPTKKHNKGPGGGGAAGSAAAPAFAAAAAGAGANAAKKRPPAGAAEGGKKARGPHLALPPNAGRAGNKAGGAAGAGNADKDRDRGADRDRDKEAGERGKGAGKVAGSVPMGSMAPGSVALTEPEVALPNARDSFLTQSVLVGIALAVSYTRCHVELQARRAAAAAGSAAETRGLAAAEGGQPTAAEAAMGAL